MWYMCWVLGVLLACAFGVINGLWLENAGRFEEDEF
ncbi:MULTISPECIES: cytochrome bd-I oxidase subunit CydX [Vibrio]|uniref:Cytochrome bd-I oxidase subunit CydX n=1 Tax=Vibrio harveyi TaxID=669 RepID=A0A8B3DLC8_VIBHA|nr:MULTISPECIES: cytochrome bd-I oxidase subunit CydX [Vibrio]AWB02966.1 cytochrome bd-I oxidase subunit CydX [Vibrio harveyi]EKO3784483.1 cytochrome bd-I oxidase subunit CydX [Vibrio harveyi]EKO3835452.1 cytochrome bd-I oxidase subunit CydX [Vibrio harveyi]EKO3841191.1 cytochrome bd-I oxidase subunit CydX [Vibrio harveyi]EKO3862265.1 cytochrome bd-I oxidase subunit CydX [Vibrio harveyi]